MSEIKPCTCGKNNWRWVLGFQSTSWIHCRNCGDSMFGPDIGVILINWKNTNLDELNLGDVVEANQRDGIV